MSASVTDPIGDWHGDIPVPSGQLHVAVQGAPDAPALVFLHALGTDLRLWEAQATHFCGTHRVIRFDMPGHGQSRVPAPARIELGTLVDNLMQVLDALRVERAALVGTSMGAVIALAAAAQQPARFTHLALCGARLHRTEAASDELRRRGAEAGRLGLTGLTGTMLARWFPAAAPSDPGLAAVAQMLAHTTPDGYAACAAALSAYDLRAALAAFTGPVLMVCGELDEDIPQHFQELARDRPQISLHCLPQAGHFPNLDLPTAFNALLGRHLESPTRGLSRAEDG